MGRLVLILGGARSGKSTMAERMALEAGRRVAFVATAQAHDEEMRRRILAHQAARPSWWRTVEEPLDLAAAVADAAPGSDAVVVDCLTLWLSNHLCQVAAPESSDEWVRAIDAMAPKLEATISRVVEIAGSEETTLLLVSNEVGLGLVPATPLGRAYRDLLGLVNRRVASEADQVLLMVAGLPLDVKRLSLGQP